jgi:hypothetical protein
MLSLLQLSAFLTRMGNDLPCRMNYVFVDFENVHETDLDRIAQKPVKVTLILGEQHKKLPVSLVKKLLQYASQVQLVETGRSGKNASDLVLANYIGEVKKVDPHGYIHILSKDKDFDALIGHYKMNGTLAARRTSFSEIPVLMNVDERATLMALNFKPVNSSRPKSRKRLVAQIQAQFGKALSPEEVEATIKRLIVDKVITVSDKEEIGYPTPTVQTLTPTTPSAPPLAPGKSKSPPKPKEQSSASMAHFTQVLKHLREHPRNRPASETTLTRHLQTVLGNKIAEAGVVAIVQELVRTKQLTIDAKNKVTYHL